MVPKEKLNMMTIYNVCRRTLYSFIQMKIDLYRTVTP
jgi:hypothetical protein